MSDSSDEEGVLAGLSRPVFSTGAANESDQDDSVAGASNDAGEDERESESSDADEGSGLLAAEAAFDFQSRPDLLDMNPFRTAGPAPSAEPEERTAPKGPG